MAVRRVAKTDNVTFGVGVTPRDGVVADRNVSIGDNFLPGAILLEDDCFLLQEDNTSKILKDVLIDLD